MRAVLILALLMGFAPVTSAMTCVRPPLEQLFARADFVFEATVETRHKLDVPPDPICWTAGDRCGPKIATLRVQRVWKGQPGEQTAIRSGDACYCLGTYLMPGERYVIFAIRASGGGSEMTDMGACATEGLGTARQRGVIEALTALAAR